MFSLATVLIHMSLAETYKPLEPKPLPATPQCLQQMLLCLPKYNLQVRYKKGKEMLLADTLSHDYLLKVNATEFSRELEDIDQCG